MTPQTIASRSADASLYILTALLFLAYLCVAVPLAVLPVHVTQTLGLSNAWAGLVVGVAFLSTILSRGYAGRITDREGGKPAVMRGLIFYVVGAVVCMAAGFIAAPVAALAVLIAGRLVIGVGESLVTVGVVGWGIGLMGPARSGRVLSLIGVAIYGAFAVGGPIGAGVAAHFGFIGAMAVAALLPCLGLIAANRMSGPAPVPHAERPGLISVLADIWRHGAVVCLQGIGFAAITSFFILYFMANGWGGAGLGFTLFGGGFVLMRVLFGGLTDRIGGIPVALGSLGIEVVGQAMIWAAPNGMVALAGAFLTGVGCSLIFPAMGREVVQRVKPHLRGTALGGFSAFQDLSYGLTGPLAGMLADRSGFGVIFLVGAIAAAAGLALTFSLRTATPAPAG